MYRHRKHFVFAIVAGHSTVYRGGRTDFSPPCTFFGFLVVMATATPTSVRSGSIDYVYHYRVVVPWLVDQCDALLLPSILLHQSL